MDGWVPATPVTLRSLRTCWSKLSSSKFEKFLFHFECFAAFCGFLTEVGTNGYSFYSMVESHIHFILQRTVFFGWRALWRRGGVGLLPSLFVEQWDICPYVLLIHLAGWLQKEKADSSGTYGRSSINGPKQCLFDLQKVRVTLSV